jgi:DNA polymerase III psi subunit
MSVSHSNQHPQQQPFAWHLQSMGINLYGVRDGIDDVMVLPAKSASDKTVPEKPKLVLLSDLTASPLISDICLLLNIKVDAIESLADNEFRLGILHWQFVTAESEAFPRIDKNQLITPPIKQLRQAKAKRALWSCLATLVDTSIDTYADTYADKQQG